MDTPRNEKTKVRIRWTSEEPRFLLLSENEIAFLKWLAEHDYLDSETFFEIDPEESELVEF